MASIDAMADIFVNAERKVTGEAALAGLGASEGSKLSPAQASQVAQEFEAMFLAQMLQALKPEESDQDSLFSNQESDEIFRSMMMEEYAKEISKAGGIGIASHIERELLGERSVAPRPVNYELSIGKYEQASNPPGQ